MDQQLNEHSTIHKNTRANVLIDRLSLRPSYDRECSCKIVTFDGLLFTDRGHGLFMCSPTEIQKLSIASDIKEQVNEMLCELYDPSVAMPEA
ncbi:unnamed protein product [Rotaria socialis]|nr:unnamed protein product [Rotaria socialis]CAF3529916.1 unnamed protein product [Rotaria socialis]CAF3729532.1 unnamed protein product [Rotaria socialis]CAF4372251.1 unnamed protein product [Rotaria socialis]CAF4553822.1 unnamed protein product [Rotaria socialis]